MTHDAESRLTRLSVVPLGDPIGRASGMWPFSPLAEAAASAAELARSVSWGARQVISVTAAAWGLAAREPGAA